jgi:hypothetical protein
MHILNKKMRAKCPHKGGVIHIKIWQVEDIAANLEYIYTLLRTAHP